MPAIVRMVQFVRFYEARPAEQPRVVREIRSQIASDWRESQKRNFYGRLSMEMRRCHWETDDLQTLKDRLASPSFIGGLPVRKQRAYQTILNVYVDYMERRGGSLFRVPRVSLNIGGLTVVVNPEFGIRTGLDNETLKLWFNLEPPSRQARQVLLHLMHLARLQSGEWQDSWNVGIFDVRRGTVLPPIRVRSTDDLQLSLEAQASAFLLLWNALEA